MNRIFLTLIASVALSSLTSLQSFADPSHRASPHDKAGTENLTEEMTKACEGHFEKIKDAGSSLPADKKAEFDYDLEIVNLEIKVLKDANHKDPKRHAHSCHQHLKNAENIVKKHEDYMTREKKKEERKAKAEERKAKAEARKAEREAAKAKREAEKAEKAAHHHAKEEEKSKHHEKENLPTHENKDGLDHGKSEGASKEEPGADIAPKPDTPETKEGHE
jgi:hypothetical protein